MKEKVNDLFRLLDAMQVKQRTAYLTLVPDKWSRIYCSEYFNVFEYLVLTSHETKKIGELLVKSTPKKWITTETLHLHLTNVYEDDDFSRQVPENKDYFSVSKGLHKKSFSTWKSLCNL